MNDLLSVIVPAYNVVNYLKKCLDSIIKQTYKNIEIIVVNDGSTDATGILCDSYAEKDDRIKVIHKQNGGRISARKAGLQISQGEYIAFIDGDDWIENDYFEILMNAFDNDVDISVSTYIIDGTNDSYLYHESIKLDQMRAISDMLKLSFFNWSICDKIYRKKVLLWSEDNWFKGDMCEDLEFNWKVFGHIKNIYYTPIRKYHYVMRESSITHENFNMEHLVTLKRWLKIEEEARKYITINPELYVFIVQKTLDVAVYFKYKIMKNKIENYFEWNSCFYKINELLLRKDILSLDKNKESFLLEAIDDSMKCLMSEKEKIISKAKQLIVRKGNLYIYGAGKYGCTIAKMFEENDIKFDGFVVTFKDDKKYIVNEKVYSIDEVEHGAFFVAVGKRAEKEILDILNEKGFKNYVCVGTYFQDHYTLFSSDL